MFTAELQNRVQEILDFIAEITLGNYTYTLPLRNRKDELEQIVLSLNTMVEEVDTTVHLINHEKSKEVIENVIFNLDQKFHITSYSTNVEEILKFPKEDLLNKPVEFCLSEDTNLPFDLDRLPEQTSGKQFPFKVEFRHVNGYQWSGRAYLHPLVTTGKEKYILSAFKSIHYNERLKNEFTDTKKGAGYPSEYRSLLLREQRQLTRKLHKYVLKRLDRKLKSLPVIAREVGGSVSKIKAIFKHAYGDTIYNYHLRKRLEKAHLLLQNTSLPVNEIAEDCGFSSFSHFSRSFKKTYGVTPSQIRKS